MVLYRRGEVEEEEEVEEVAAEEGEGG